MNVWIEYRRDNNHGGKGWNLGEALWSPTRAKNGIKRGYYENVNKVKKGDIIFHILRKAKTDIAYFHAYSIAKSDGYITKEIPLLPDEWSYSNEFYKVDLENFQLIKNTINLKDIYRIKRKQLENYLKTTNKKNILFSRKIRTNQGAYLSTADLDLINIMLDLNLEDNNNEDLQINVKTGITKSLVNIRRGQQLFSKYTKKNFNNTCCFPSCDVDDKEFLIGSHIERWADNEDKRGSISNGLCFCLLHDKAFENGYFSLDDNYRILLNDKYEKSNFYIHHLKPFNNKEIKSREINPDIESLKRHRKRHGIKNKRDQSS